MEVLQTIKEVREKIDAYRRKGATVGFVPTMGALHAGHLSLVQAAREENEIVVVSVFVNPTQFSASEDYAIYPRNLEQDAALCEKAGVDVVFAPSVKEMYPEGFSTFVSVEGFDNKMCGLSRPGHFRGVATVVTKLFNIVRPDKAYFGQKDWQQCALIKKMANDLNLPVAIEICPTVRDADGVAMSSRNAYLSEQERKTAAIIPEALKYAKKLILSGEKNPAKIKELAVAYLGQEPGIDLEYFVLADPETLEDLSVIEGRTLIAIAAKIGKTRLIDNIIIM